MMLFLALLACAPVQVDHGRSFAAAMAAQADRSRIDAPVSLTGREAEALRLGRSDTAPTTPASPTTAPRANAEAR